MIACRQHLFNHRGQTVNLYQLIPECYMKTASVNSLPENEELCNAPNVLEKMDMGLVPKENDSVGVQQENI